MRMKVKVPIIITNTSQSYTVRIIQQNNKQGPLPLTYHSVTQYGGTGYSTQAIKKKLNIETLRTSNAIMFPNLIFTNRPPLPDYAFFWAPVRLWETTNLSLSTVFRGCNFSFFCLFSCGFYDDDVGTLALLQYVWPAVNWSLKHVWWVYMMFYGWENERSARQSPSVNQTWLN